MNAIKNLTIKKYIVMILLFILFFINFMYKQINMFTY